MDSNDATLCLDDIRSVRLTVNEILKLMKTGGHQGASSTSVQLLTNSQDTALSSKLNKILRLLQQPVTTTTMNPSTPTTDIPLLAVAGEELFQDDLRYHQPDPNEVFVTLLLSSLGAWLAVVLLALTWMRLTDLRYRPSVVS